MSLTLAFVDSQNGTGGVATIAGTSGAAVTVYGQTIGNGSFSVAGSRTGDGTVTLSLAVAYWWLYATTATLQSNILGPAAVSDNAESVADRCHEAIQAILQGMTFAAGSSNRPPAIPSGRVYDQFAFNPANYSYPCIVVDDELEVESEQGLTAGLDDLIYPIHIKILDRCSLNEAIARRKTYRLWRQQIARRFRQNRLPVTEEIYTTVRYGPTLFSDANDAKSQPNAFQGFASVLTLLPRCREIRG